MFSTRHEKDIEKLFWGQTLKVLVFSTMHVLYTSYSKSFRPICLLDHYMITIQTLLYIYLILHCFFSCKSTDKIINLRLLNLHNTILYHYICYWNQRRCRRLRLMKSWSSMWLFYSPMRFTAQDTFILCEIIWTEGGNVSQ